MRVSSIKGMSKSQLSRRRLKTHISDPPDAAKTPVAGAAKPVQSDVPSEDEAMEEARQNEHPEAKRDEESEEEAAAKKGSDGVPSDADGGRGQVSDCDGSSDSEGSS
jgi:hypothetical protein